MEHPFINKSDLENKSLEELQETMSGLMNKLTFAYRTGNQSLINQLQMVLESYRAQHDNKMNEIFSKQRIGNQINIQSQGNELH